MPTIIYHKADADGRLSCAIIAKMLSEQGVDRVDFFGWNYGDPLPVVDGDDDVYMVDVSDSRMVDTYGERLIWIDHHKSAIAAFEGRDIRGLRRDGTAACRLCWEWAGMGEEDTLVKLLGMFDVWDKSSTWVDLAHYGTYCWDVLDYLEYLYLSDEQRGNEVANIIDDGKAVQRYVEAQDEYAASSSAYRVRFNDGTWLVMNGRGNSMVFDSVDQEGVDGLMLWRVEVDRVRLSFYQPKGGSEVDMSEVARAFGGGGHRAAAGCQMDLEYGLEFITRLTPV